MRELRLEEYHYISGCGSPGQSLQNIACSMAVAGGVSVGSMLGAIEGFHSAKIALAITGSVTLESLTFESAAILAGYTTVGFIAGMFIYGYAAYYGMHALIWAYNKL